MTWVWSRASYWFPVTPKIGFKGQVSGLWGRERAEWNSLLSPRLQTQDASEQQPWSSLLTSHLNPSVQHQWVGDSARFLVHSNTFFDFYFLFPYQLHLVHFKSKRYGRNAAYFSRIFELERIIKWLRTVNVECLELWVNYSVGHKRLLLAEAVFEVR